MEKESLDTSSKARPNTRLRDARVAQRLTHEELAQKIEVQPVTISRWERGIASPGLRNARRLCEILGKSAEDLGLVPTADGQYEHQKGSAESSSSQFPVPHRKQSEEPHNEQKPLLPAVGQNSHRSDWGEAPDLRWLYGRDQELVRLKHWVTDDSCRLVAILGMGGMGKTSLAAALADQVQEHFDYLFWRSLQNRPSLESLLQECIPFISDQRHTQLPAEEDRQITLLIDCLRTSRCLLVLDNVESILQGGSHTGQYREGYEGYGKLFQRISESRHQSCLLVTSREKPKEVALLEGVKAPTRSYPLAGLSSTDGRDILKDKGLEGSEHTWEKLITAYAGNPLALQLVGQLIREVFDGDIIAFLRKGEVLFHDIRDVLEQQMVRLSELEEEIIYWLAIQREASGFDVLTKLMIAHPVSNGELQEALRSLRRRHLIQASATGYMLHPVIMEYLTARFVDRMSEEIRTERFLLFERHAVLLAQARDYIRESQRHLIVQPLVQRLLTIFGKEALEQRLQNLLIRLHESHDQRSSYAAGNILNLLIQAGYDLSGYDFSYLVVWQAYLQEVALCRVNFAYADLTTSVFTDTFGSILCVALNQQEDLLVAGTGGGEIRCWHAGTGLPLHTLQGHTSWIYSVAFSPDGNILASSSNDQTIRLWEASSGKLINILRGHHTQEVWSVAFSPDGSLLASSSSDQTICLWEVSSGKILKTLKGHTGWIRSVAFSPDGNMLVSGSDDHTICLWEVSSGKILKTLKGHTQEVWSVAFSPDGSILASGSTDQTICLWEVSSGKILKTLKGHTGWVFSIAFNKDGSLLASGSSDQTVRLWDVSSGKLLNTLQGHTQEVRSVVFSSDGNTLASGSSDPMVCLWEVSSGRMLRSLRGYTQEVRSVAFSPAGNVLASGCEDQAIRLWEASSGTCFSTLGHSGWIYSVAFSPDGSILASGSSDQTICLRRVSSSKMLKTLKGHTGWIRSVAFSPDGSILASGGDQTVRLWEVSSGKVIDILEGHTLGVCSVAFSPDGSVLTSGSSDQTICLWEVSSGKAIKTLKGHTGWIYSVAFSPDGSILASGSEDQTVRLWDVSSGKVLKTLKGHTGWIYSVAFSPDGSILASCGGDRTVRLWDVSSGKVLKTLKGHTGWVFSVAFNLDGSILASGSSDQTVRLWDVSSGSCLHILRSDRPYERMNITQVKGLTEGQKATLRLLGAIENE